MLVHPFDGHASWCASRNTPAFHVLRLLCNCGPMDPWDPSHSGPFLDEVDEEDDVYEPEDYTGDYPLEIEGEDDE